MSRVSPAAGEEVAPYEDARDAGFHCGALILGCGGDDTTGLREPQPQPGELRVEMTGSPVGGVVLTVTGTGITAPAVSGGATLPRPVRGHAARGGYRIVAVRHDHEVHGAGR